MQRGRMELACRRLGSMLQQPGNSQCRRSLHRVVGAREVLRARASTATFSVQVLKLWSRARRRLELTLQQEELLLAHHFRPKMPTLRILGVLGGSSFLPQRKEGICGL